MNLKDHFRLLATYNQRMNTQMYQAARKLSDVELREDREAFFASILGTLNHVVVGDIIWLKRFATHPACLNSLREVADLENPTGLDQVLFDNLGSLFERRSWLDNLIVSWIDELTEDDLGFVLRYQNTKGIPANKRFSSLLLHFFNHQTHHRGQVSTLLSQAGVDVGITDLLLYIPQEDSAY